MAKLTFTTPLNLANIRAAKIGKVREIDEDAKSLIVNVTLQGAALPYDTLYSLFITNGPCDAIQANGSPTTILRAIAVVSITSATAFDQVFAAYRAAGDARTNVLTTLAALGILPAGTVA